MGENTDNGNDVEDSTQNKTIQDLEFENKAIHFNFFMSRLLVFLKLLL